MLASCFKLTEHHHTKQCGIGELFFYPDETMTQLLNNQHYTLTFSGCCSGSFSLLFKFHTQRLIRLPHLFLEDMNDLVASLNDHSGKVMDMSCSQRTVYRLLDIFQDIFSFRTFWIFSKIYTPCLCRYRSLPVSVNGGTSFKIRKLFEILKNFQTVCKCHKNEENSVFSKLFWSLKISNFISFVRF